MTGFDRFLGLKGHCKSPVLENYIFVSPPNKSVFRPIISISGRFCGGLFPAGMGWQFSIAENYF
jgi:hypothetical protein